MQISTLSVLVDDQDKALRFYTAVLGFTKKADMPMGLSRWLTVASPEGVAGVELFLRPVSVFPPAAVYQKALFDAGIPATGFISKDIDAEFARMKANGVNFRGSPAVMGPIKSVVFEDTCGNLISLVQPTI